MTRTYTFSLLLRLHGVGDIVFSVIIMLVLCYVLFLLLLQGDIVQGAPYIATIF